MQAKLSRAATTYNCDNALFIINCTQRQVKEGGCYTCRPHGLHRYLHFSFPCIFVTGSEKSTERTFIPVELSFHGTFHGNESSLCRLLAYGNESAWEQKVQIPMQPVRPTCVTPSLLDLPLCAVYLQVPPLWNVRSSGT